MLDMILLQLIVRFLIGINQDCDRNMETHNHKFASLLLTTGCQQQVTSLHVFLIPLTFLKHKWRYLSL